MTEVRIIRGQVCPRVHHSLFIVRNVKQRLATPFCSSLIFRMRNLDTHQNQVDPSTNLNSVYRLPNTRRHPNNIRSRVQARHRCLYRQPVRLTHRTASRPCHSCRLPWRPMRHHRSSPGPSTDSSHRRWSRSKTSRERTAVPWDSVRRLCNPVHRCWGTVWVQLRPHLLSILRHEPVELSGRRRARDQRSSTSILESVRCVRQATDCKAVLARPRD